MAAFASHLTPYSQPRIPQDQFSNNLFEVKSWSQGLLLGSLKQSQDFIGSHNPLGGWTGKKQCFIQSKFSRIIFIIDSFIIYKREELNSPPFSTELPLTLKSQPLPPSLLFAWSGFSQGTASKQPCPWGARANKGAASSQPPLPCQPQWNHSLHGGLDSCF